jgi:hypothetical protein
LQAAARADARFPTAVRRRYLARWRDALVMQRTADAQTLRRAPLVRRVIITWRTALFLERAEVAAAARARIRLAHGTGIPYDLFV